MKQSYPDRHGDRVLVTGASGFIGVKVVETLLEYGFSNIRCFTRRTSQVARLEGVLGRLSAGRNVEVFTGDLSSREDCANAATGVSIIYHLAAGFDKSFAGAFMNSVLTTRNLIEAFLEHGQPTRFVNVSSFAVYSTLNLKRGAVIDETCPLEDAPQERYDAYGFGKLRQEQLVSQYGSERHLPFVNLRPGTVFGPGKKELSGRVGVDTFGFFVQVGGSNLLPLTFVDNCAEAIVLAGLKPGVDGETFNVVDDELLTSAQFLRAYRQRVADFSCVRIPYGVAWALCRGWQEYARRSEGQIPPAFNIRRCAADWKPTRFSNEKIRRLLGWTPRIGSEKAMQLFLGQFDPRIV